MLISEFSRLTGLPRDTVRFYVRLRLLQPRASLQGGRHPYQVFGQEDLQFAEVIRIAQALGLSLKEIAPLIQARREGRASPERSVEVLSGRLAAVEQSAARLEAIAAYLRAKIAWLQDGASTTAGMPTFEQHVGETAPPGLVAPRRRRTIRR